jgi:hypothetical protein
LSYRVQWEGPGLSSVGFSLQPSDPHPLTPSPGSGEGERTENLDDWGGETAPIIQIFGLSPLLSPVFRGEKGQGDERGKNLHLKGGQGGGAKAEKLRKSLHPE